MFGERQRSWFVNFFSFCTWKICMHTLVKLIKKYAYKLRTQKMCSAILLIVRHRIVYASEVHRVGCQCHLSGHVAFTVTVSVYIQDGNFIYIFFYFNTGQWQLISLFGILFLLKVLVSYRSKYTIFVPLNVIEQLK